MRLKFWMCFILNVATLTLGSQPWQGGCKVAGQKGNQEVTFHALGSAKKCEGVNLHTPKWIPCWELKSQWTLEFLEHDCKGENSSTWRFLHIIGKLLKLKCLKWARITHLDIWNTSYDQKKSWESNWQFDSRPLMSQPHFGQVWGWSPTLPKLGIWSPSGLSNV
jgi:hypothetical protein